MSGEGRVRVLGVVQLPVDPLDFGWELVPVMGFVVRLDLADLLNLCSTIMKKANCARMFNLDTPKNPHSAFVTMEGTEDHGGRRHHGLCRSGSRERRHGSIDKLECWRTKKRANPSDNGRLLWVVLVMDHART
jgi:hypothetical protein